jgi:enamine deaminase RidA (YjgF/YER057c/UK114 family)
MGRGDWIIGGIMPATKSTAADAGPAIPCLHVPMNCLGGDAYAQQWWSVETEPTTGVGSDIALAWSQTDRYMFAVASIDDSAPIEQQSAYAYCSLLRTIREHGKPHLFRLWNFIPRINEPDAGGERYRSFNSGRRQAYHESGYTLAEGAPAACALGIDEGAFQIAVLAGTAPAVAIENPRQVSSHRYPKIYGAVPPIFSRATWLPQADGGDLLFVSGTASIVGHETLHAGDVLAQTAEAVRNLSAVIDSANREAGAALWTLGGLCGRVYLRHAADYTVVSKYLRSVGMHRFCYMRADICRSDLLVEIEAEGQAPHAS